MVNFSSAFLADAHINFLLHHAEVNLLVAGDAAPIGFAPVADKAFIGLLRVFQVESVPVLYLHKSLGSFYLMGGDNCVNPAGDGWF